MAMASTCKTCGEPIEWMLLTRRDGEIARVPVDRLPVQAGNIAGSKDVHGQLHGRVLADGEQLRPLEHRYRSHFASCAQASTHRKPRPATPPPAVDDTFQPELF